MIQADRRAENPIDSSRYGGGPQVVLCSITQTSCIFDPLFSREAYGLFKIYIMFGAYISLMRQLGENRIL